MTDATQPARLPEDGEASVHRVNPDHICIAADLNGETQRVYVSNYNAWRLFGMLAFMLGIKLPAKLLREIKL